MNIDVGDSHQKCQVPAFFSDNDIDSLYKMTLFPIYKLLLSFLYIGNAVAWPIISVQSVLKPFAALPDDNGPKYSLPMFDTRSWERVDEIRLARAGYIYGPPLLGNTSFFPTGVLGEAMVARDRVAWFKDVEYVTNNVYLELDKAAAALIKVCRQKSLCLKWALANHIRWGAYNHSPAMRFFTKINGPPHSRTVYPPGC